MPHTGKTVFFLATLISAILFVTVSCTAAETSVSSKENESKETLESKTETIKDVPANKTDEDTVKMDISKKSAEDIIAIGLMTVGDSEKSLKSNVGPDKTLTEISRAEDTTGSTTAIKDATNYQIPVEVEEYIISFDDPRPKVSPKMKDLLVKPITLSIPREQSKPMVEPRTTLTILDTTVLQKSISSIPLSAHQALDGPIIIAIPLHTRDLATFYVSRGLRSLGRTSSSLAFIYDVLTTPTPQVGLTLPAAHTLRSSYLNWPVKEFVLGETVTLEDVANTNKSPTILIVPKTSIESARDVGDTHTIGDFTFLEDGISYVVPVLPK